MRLVSLSYELIGQTLAKTIYTADGRALLKAGTILTQNYIDALIAKGFRSVYIPNELIPDLEIDDAINEVTRVKATAIIQEGITNIAKGKRFDLQPVFSVVEEILEQLQGRSDLVFALSNLRSMDDYTFVHSVNVCVSALVLGNALHLPQVDLYKLGVGAILHDVGKVRVSPEILNKPSKLTPQEMERVRSHAFAGFDILRSYFTVDLLSAHVALQHHEKIDGSGYPRGLSGEEIHQYGRIAAIADVYDALSSDRPYRKRLMPHEVTRHLISLAGTHLDRHMVYKFLEKVSIYPVGSIVRLNTGELAVVISQVNSDIEHPVVRVVTDRRYQLIKPYDINLSLHSELKITAVLEDYPQLVKEQIRHRKPHVQKL